MAKFPFNLFKRATYQGNWDLKGSTLIDIIRETSGGAVSQENAMKFTAVLAAVSLRSGLVASFPKIIYDQTKDGRSPDYENPLYKIIAYNPNPYMNGFTFWELVNTHLDLWGNAYVFISRYGGEVIRLTPVHPRNVTPVTEGGKLMYKVERTEDSVLDRLHSPDKFLHFKDISFDGIIGKSRISLANDAISIAQSAEKFGKEFFDKAGHAKGIIKVPGQMSPEAFDNLVKHWNKAGNHGTPVLDMGKDYMQLDIPMADAQFISTREFQLQDIARIFGLSPHLIGDLSRATFSNIESLDIQAVKYTFRPLVKRYEQELEFKLLGDDLGKKTIRFNLDNLLRGDTATRAEYLAKMVQNKIFNRNEARAYENKNPVPGGDVFENPATSSGKNNNDGNNS